MTVDVLLGLQWGDEGKGKIVDYLAPNYDIIGRFQGGPNAGHTLKFGGQKFVLHTVPSGIFRPGIENIIGSGVVVDPITLCEELALLEGANVDYADRLLLARQAHLILPTHRLLDKASELSKGADKIGSTLRGIGPTYMDKTGRNGLRVGDYFRPNFQEKYQELKKKHLGLLKIYPAFSYDLEKSEEAWMESMEKLRDLRVIDCAYHLRGALKSGKRVLAEGAQGSMLDINFGTYPFVTSSTTLTAGVCIGLGIPPSVIGEVIGITKAYCTRVGSGPFPSELNDADGERLRKFGSEFGATTGRPRRCGWLDVPQLRYTIMLNGVTQLALTKVDVLDHFEEIKVVSNYDFGNGPTDQVPFDYTGEELTTLMETHTGWHTALSDVTTYEGLPSATRSYIDSLERSLETKISMISTGPERDKLILRP
ncbi:MAG: adenylosuccinate synthase [Saprospiraceae bacterium]|nr:adenylosuccinate synthase [Saprospiraceae bacterium]